MDQDDYTRAWHRTLRHCLRVLQRHRRAVQIAKPTNSDEEQIASDQLRLVTALEQPIRVALLETDPLALKRWVGEIKRQFARAKCHPAISTSRLEPLCDVRLNARLGFAELSQVALYIRIGTVQCVAPLPARVRVDADCLQGEEHIEYRVREVQLFERGQLGSAGDCVAVLIVAVNGIL